MSVAKAEKQFWSIQLSTEPVECLIEPFSSDPADALNPPGVSSIVANLWQTQRVLEFCDGHADLEIWFGSEDQDVMVVHISRPSCFRFCRPRLSI